jgi:hypothetical protein
MHHGNRPAQNPANRIGVGMVTEIEAGPPALINYLVKERGKKHTLAFDGVKVVEYQGAVRVSWRNIKYRR